MSLAEDTRVNVPVPFPTLVISSGPITLAKKNGIWSVGISFTTVAQAYPPSTAWATDLILVWDSVAQTFVTVSLATISMMVTAGAVPPVAYDTAAGTYNVTNEQILLVNKTTPAANAVLLPPASTRGGVPIVIKDFAGNSGTYTITITPNGAEKIDGLSALPLASNYGFYKLVPLAGGGWFMSA